IVVFWAVVHHRSTHDQIVVEKCSRIGTIGTNTAYVTGNMDHSLRPGRLIYAFNAFNLCQVVLLPAWNKNSGSGLRFKLCDNTPSQKAGTTGDKNTPICPETHDA